jgi:hypothetical protein
MYGKFNHGIWGYPLVGEKKHVDWKLWMLFFKAHIEIEILSMNNRKIIFHNSLFLLGWVSIRPHFTIYQYLPHSTGLAIPLNIPLPIGHQGLMIPAICGK